MNVLKKQQPKFLTDTELLDLREKVKSREYEIELRKKQFITEKEFNNLNKGNNFDPEKLKKWLIIGVAGIFIAIIAWKVIGKFI